MSCFFTDLYPVLWCIFVFSWPHPNQGRAPAGHKNQTVRCERETVQSCANKLHWDDTRRFSVSQKPEFLSLFFFCNLSSPYLSRIGLSPEICCGIYSAAPHSVLMSDVCNECLDRQDRRPEQPVSLDVLAEAAQGAPLRWCCQHSGIWHVRNTFTPHHTLSQMPTCHFVRGLSPARPTTRPTLSSVLGHAKRRKKTLASPTGGKLLDVIAFFYEFVHIGLMQAEDMIHNVYKNKGGQIHFICSDAW